MTVPTTRRTALADFVLECIAEDEETAQAALERDSAVYDWAVLRDRKFTLADSTHIPRWDPQRVLTVCAAHRRLVGMYQVAQVIQTCNAYPGEEDVVDATITTAESAVRVLATTYADRAGYREEWKP